MKKNIGILLLICIMITLSACNEVHEDQEEKDVNNSTTIIECKSQEAQNVDDLISAINTEDILASEENIVSAENAYNKLDDKQKKETELYTSLQEFRSKLNVLLEEINVVQRSVNNIKNEQAPLQSEIDLLTSKYEILTDTQQSRVTNYDNAIVLRECEIVAIQAVNQLSSFLKNESSLELISVKVKMNSTNMLGDGVLIEYSATNSFGGRIDDLACLDITDKGEDPFFALSYLYGTTNEMMLNNYTSYLESFSLEVEIDCDRIIKNRENV